MIFFCLAHLSEKEEVIELLELNRAEEKRKILQKEHKSSKKEYRSGKLEFSGNIGELKKML